MVFNTYEFVRINDILVFILFYTTIVTLEDMEVYKTRIDYSRYY